MASITKRPDGKKWIQFYAVTSDGKPGPRHTLRIGAASDAKADKVCEHVEHLIVAKKTGDAIEPEQRLWLSKLDDRLYGVLVRAGLVEPRKTTPAGPMLKEFLDDFIRLRDTVKESTRVVYGHTKRNLIEYFGADKPIGDITEGDADDWLLHLKRAKLADNTIRRRCGIAKQLFRRGIRKHLIPSNPFAELKCTVGGNEERKYFVTRQQTAAVLEHCPDREWKLLFALSRFGGLRCPSEHLALRWQDIDWERNRFTVHSPKTEHHESKGIRVVPIFPELLPFLQDCFDHAADGAEFVITRYRDTNQNLRTQLNRIIKRAKLVPWPKLFHNLRASRETELTREHPIHVVCKWIGHGRLIAQEHYLQVTDEDFEAAVKRNPKRYEAVQPRTEPVATPISREKTNNTAEYGSVCDGDVGGTGREPARIPSENRESAKSEAVCEAIGPWLDACPVTLTPDARQSIARIIAEHA